MFLRQISSRGHSILRQCSRMTPVQISNRGYADMVFTLASPSDVYYHNAKVNQVDVPSLSGSFGILADHVPTLGVLQPGVVTVFESDTSVKKFFVSSGSITINDDSTVQVLAEEAHPVDRLDIQAIREGLTKAQQELISATSERGKAEAQITVDCYESLQKALE